MEETLRITASHEIIEKVKAFVQSFQDVKLELSTDSELFKTEQLYLKRQLDTIDQGKAVFYSIEEADEILVRRYLGDT